MVFTIVCYCMEWGAKWRSSHNGLACRSLQFLCRSRTWHSRGSANASCRSRNALMVAVWVGSLSWNRERARFLVWLAIGSVSLERRVGSKGDDGRSEYTKHPSALLSPLSLYKTRQFDTVCTSHFFRSWLVNNSLAASVNSFRRDTTLST